MADIEKLARLLAASKDTLVLTGAGISTESGIPDFRSPGTGLWSKIDPMELFSREIFARDPEGFWRRGRPLFREMAAAEPNKGHYALARLEKAGAIRGIVTQNIDSLHQKAGARTVLEVHGHLRSVYCPGCGEQMDMTPILDEENAGNAPRCRCGKAMRPHVVLFGDPLPEAFQVAWSWARVCDLLLVVGSSLAVSPVCWLVPQAKQVAIINLSATQGDELATVIVRGKAGPALSTLASLLVKNP